MELRCGWWIVGDEEGFDCCWENWARTVERVVRRWLVSEAERVRRRCARWGSERRYIVMDVVAVMRFGEVKSRILG